MSELSFDEALDLSLDLLETGANEDTEALATWVVDNLVHILDEYRSGACSRCDVAGYEVVRVADRIIIMNHRSEIMGSNQAKMLASALIRAAEAADQEL